MWNLKAAGYNNHIVTVEEMLTWRQGPEGWEGSYSFQSPLEENQGICCFVLYRRKDPRFDPCSFADSW